MVKSSLNFILGTATVDHQAAMVDQLATQLTENSQDRFFYLVPNHIKFSTEIDVLSQLKAKQTGPIYAQSQVQVLSFSRLAWFLLRDQPEFNAPRISPTGLTMLTAAVLREMPVADLKLFAKEAHQPGFIQDLTKQLVELRNANIAPEDYEEIKAKSTAWAKSHHLVDAAYDDKLDVLFKVYAKFMAALGSQLETPAIYDLLIEKLNQGDFKDCHFYLDRYNAQFSAKEEQIVEAMIKNGATTTVSLVLDRPYQGSTLPDEHDLFYQPGLIYHRLANFALNTPGVELKPVTYAQTSRVAPAFKDLEHWLAANSQFVTPREAKTAGENIHFNTVPTRLAELDFVAAQIRQLVTHQGYRYRDFLILTRRLDAYETMLEPTFAAHQVPFFNDNDRTMKNHPLVTLVMGLFQLLWGQFQLADLMQILKTGLLIPKEQVDGQPLTAFQFRQDLYLTENWALKYGKTGYAWLGNKDFQYTPGYQASGENSFRDQQEAKKSTQLNRVRRYVKRQIVPFIEAIRQAKNGREAAKLLFEFFVQQGVPDQLAKWQRAATNAGNLTLSQEPEQVWNSFCQLLDEYVLTMGDQANFSLTAFRDLLLVGFQTATYSQIPSTLDQVLVSESGITQTEHRKVVFIIGATDDVMPTMQVETGLLTEDDRRRLASGLKDYQYLPVSGMEKVTNEPFVNYLAMMTGMEQLYLVAPLQSSEDQPAGLSPYLTGLSTYFNRPIVNLPGTPQPLANFTEIKPFISAIPATRSSFIRARRVAQDNGQNLSANETWKVVARIINGQKTGRHVDLNKYQYHNDPQPLTPALAEQLYGKLDRETIIERTEMEKAGQPLPPLDDAKRHSTLKASVSQLQTYYQNPYEYFLKYGLDLKRREEFEITPADSGTFYHNVMEAFVHSTGTKLATLTPAELVTYTNQALTQAAQAQALLTELGDGQLRFAYQFDHLKQLAEAMTRVLYLQAKVSHAQPKYTEKSFGSGANAIFRPITHILADQRHQVEIRGRIDRLDQVQTADQLYQMVIDYKSSDRKFDLVRATTGLDLQLLTYLAAVKQDLKHGQIGGAFYLHLANRILKPEDFKKSLTEIQLDNHLYNGLVLGDVELLKQLDQGLDQEKKGKLLNARYIKKSTSYKANSGSSILTPTELDWLLTKNTELIRQAATEIFAGETVLAPYRLGSQNGLENSDYLPIFAFDNVLDQDKFKDITLTEKDVLSQMHADQKSATENDKEG